MDEGMDGCRFICMYIHMDESMRTYRGSKEGKNRIRNFFSQTIKSFVRVSKAIEEEKERKGRLGIFFSHKMYLPYERKGSAPDKSHKGWGIPCRNSCSRCGCET